MLEDELLKLRFRRGSREALARIYEKYVDTMLTLAVGLLNNTAEAEDVVHDVFVSFAQSAHDFRVRGSLGGYLATSVANRVRDHRRRQRREPVKSSRSEIHQRATPRPSPTRGEFSCARPNSGAPFAESDTWNSGDGTKGVESHPLRMARPSKAGATWHAACSASGEWSNRT